MVGASANCELAFDIKTLARDRATSRYNVATKAQVPHMVVSLLVGLRYTSRARLVHPPHPR